MAPEVTTPAITVHGNLDLLDKALLGFFCSVRCPGDTILKTYDLASALRESGVTFIGGFQSTMEEEFLELVLRGSATAVVCPAQGLGTMRIPKRWKTPLADGRLLFLSFFDDNILRPTAAIAARRNAYVATIADRLLIAHAEKGGKIEELCKKVIEQGKPIFTIDSQDNSHLLRSGVRPVQVNGLAQLLSSTIGQL